MPRKMSVLDDFEFHDIDENDLVQEWVRQPKAVFEIAMKHRDAIRVLSERKADLEVTRANIDKDVRANPDAYDLEKVTEKSIEAVVLSNKTYQDGLTEVFDAKHDVDTLSGALQALEHRKRALESLVSLHGQSYFATPRTDDKGKEVLKEQSRPRAKKSQRRRKRE